MTPQPLPKLKILCAFNARHESYAFDDDTLGLRNAGHEVVKVRSLEMMHKKLSQATSAQKPFDVLLADYYLPHKKGGSTVYYTRQNLDSAISAKIKCVGLFSPENENICQFEILRKHKLLIMTDSTCRTVTQQRDTLKILNMVWDNYEASLISDGIDILRAIEESWMARDEPL
ncbi:MAG: hypothetical protein FGM57_01475 [Candidatus Taylorbacteria bacterium]|nr:hypothetical protein [Candidatus Taylorbacteria bacterium]